MKECWWLPLQLTWAGWSGQDRFFEASRVCQSDLGEMLLPSKVLSNRRAERVAWQSCAPAVAVGAKAASSWLQVMKGSGVFPSPKGVSYPTESSRHRESCQTAKQRLLCGAETSAHAAEALGGFAGIIQLHGRAGTALPIYGGCVQLCPGCGDRSHAQGQPCRRESPVPHPEPLWQAGMEASRAGGTV